MEYESKRENMHQNTSGNEFTEKDIKKFAKELHLLQESSKTQNDKLDEYEEEFTLLKKEMNKIKEINSKTKDYLLLELESNLDKQKQIQIEQKIKYDLFDDSFKILNEENDKFKQILELKNNDIKSLEHEINDFKRIIYSKEEKINSLNEEISELRDLITLKDKDIDLLKKELNKSRMECDDLNNMIKNKENANNGLVNKNNLLNIKIQALKYFVSDFEAKINDYDNIISSLKGNLDNKEEISELNDNITNHNDFLLNDNKKFQVVLYQRESELIDLEKKLKQLKMSLIF